MVRKKLSTRDWWIKRLNELEGDGKVNAANLYSQLPPNLKQIVDGKTWEYWTVFKLAIHSYYLRLYTDIIKKHFKRIAYIDTFAGPGLIKVGKKGANYFFGSPLLGILHPRKKFDHLIFIELDKNKKDVLEYLLKILSKIGHNNSTYQVIQGDMNKVNYREILSSIDHSLVFIDPEGMEVDFSTIKKLSKLRCDLEINYMDSSVRRVFGAKEQLQNRGKLESFFGKDVSNVSELDQLFYFYLRNIENSDRVTRHIRVKGLGSFEYKIIFAVRPTAGGNPWLEPLEDLKRRVENTSKETFNAILNQFIGEQASLD